MQFLTRGLGALALMLALALPAGAGWNIHQKDDGSTVWEDDAGRSVHVLESYVTVLLENISSAGSTSFVVIPIAGDITTIYSVLRGAISGADAALAFFKSTGSGSGATFTEVSNGTGRLTITQSGSAEGDVDTFTPSNANTVVKGGVIRVQTDGGNSDDEDVIITIIIDPK